MFDKHHTVANSLILLSYMETITTENGALWSFVAAQLGWLLLVLLCKLDTKAKSYIDVSLSYPFLANNLNFTVKIVVKMNLKVQIGSYWVAHYRFTTANQSNELLVRAGNSLFKFSIFKTSIFVKKLVTIIFLGYLTFFYVISVVFAFWWNLQY